MISVFRGCPSAKRDKNNYYCRLAGDNSELSVVKRKFSEDFLWTLNRLLVSY